MAEPLDLVDVVPLSSEQFRLMSQRLEKVSSLLESASHVAPHPHEPSLDPGRSNLDWLTAIEVRIKNCDAAIRHNQKRAMIWAGIALVLAAIGAALVVNRLSPDLTVGGSGTRGLTLLKPGTAIWLTAFVALSLAATSIVSRLQSTAASRSNQWTIMLFAFVVAAYGGFLGVSGAQGSGPEGAFRLGHGSIGAALLAASLGLFIVSRYYSRKSRRSEQDLTDLQFEHDLLRHAVKPFQTRAEKLLSVNQIQLRRYYELNLDQAKAVFVVGIGCIMLGLVVVGVTLSFVYWLGNQPNQETQIYTQAIVGLLGAVGTVLTNFVAYMYFKLHGSITDSLMTFHKQLAGIHDVFFANVLAASVEDDVKRADTLVHLANAIAERRVDLSSSNKAT